MDYSKIIRYLKDEVSEEEINEIIDWKSNPKNQLKFDEIKQIWETSKKTNQVFHPSTQKAWESVNSSIKVKGKEKSVIKRFYPYAAIAAGFLLIFTIAWFLKINLRSDQNIPEQAWITVNTIEEITKIDLSDGTQIWLNKNSSITYPELFNKTNREVKLNGEAFFEVAHNKEKPFKVYTELSVTQVLGTSFNISTKNQSNKTEINVISGKVAFSDSKNTNRNLVLTKNEKAVITASNLIKHKIDPNMNFLAWKTKTLRFNQTPLNKVCNYLSEYYDQEILLENKNMEGLELTASFHEQSLEDVLDVINLTLDTKYEIKDSSIILKQL